MDEANSPSGSLDLIRSGYAIHMNWYFPLVPAILIAILFWATRETLRTGRVEKMGMVVRRGEKPVTFWAFVVTQWFWIAMMMTVLGMWAIDFNGMRTG